MAYSFWDQPPARRSATPARRVLASSWRLVTRASEAARFAFESVTSPRHGRLAETDHGHAGAGAGD